MATVESLGYKITFSAAEFHLVKNAVEYALNTITSGPEHDAYVAFLASLTEVQ